MNQHVLGRGIALSVAASTLFALMSAYTKWLAPLDGLHIFAWRVVWTLPGTLALVILRKRWPHLSALCSRLAQSPLLLAGFAITSALLGLQLWIFLWAPLHGRALEVSLGYFLLPLAMVLLGRFYYREPLDAFQWAGVAAACVGVAHELFVTRAFAWPTLVVMLGYPPYFVLRRKLNVDPLVSFAMEILLMTPLAIVIFSRATRSPSSLEDRICGCCCCLDSARYRRSRWRRTGVQVVICRSRSSAFSATWNRCCSSAWR